MADQRALFESMHKVGLPDAKITSSKWQRWILLALAGLFLFAASVYVTREQVVHPTGASAALAR